MENDQKGKVLIDDKILAVLASVDPGYGGIGEWDIACRIYPFGDVEQRAKRGAWIRVIVQALRRLEKIEKAGMFWTSHGDGVPGSRIWFKR